MRLLRGAELFSFLGRSFESATAGQLFFAGVDAAAINHDRRPHHAWFDTEIRCARCEATWATHSRGRAAPSAALLLQFRIAEPSSQTRVQKHLLA